MTRRIPDPANIGRRDTRWQSRRPWFRAKQAMFAAYGTDCWWCGHPGAYEADHLVRLADGGHPTDLDNLRPSHGSNAPCPVCTSPTTGRPRCCNQERNRKARPARAPLVVDPRNI